METHWQGSIQRELIALGYFEAYDEWAKEQREAA